MDIPLENKLDYQALSNACNALHTLICKMQTPKELNKETVEEYQSLIKTSLDSFNIFARDIEQCGSKKVPWQFCTSSHKNRWKNFFLKQIKEIKSVWQEDKTYTMKPEQFTQKMLDIVALIQKKLIHASICLDLYFKYPMPEHEEQFMQNYTNLRQLFGIHKQLIDALQSKKITLKDNSWINRLEQISEICQYDIPLFNDLELIENKLMHKVGSSLGYVNDKLLFGHAVTHGILSQEHLSSTVVAILDPAISAENLKRIENSKLLMALLKLFMPKKYQSIQNGIDQGVPPSEIIKGVREFIDNHPPLASLKPPILKTLNNPILSTWVIDPAACLTSFCWRTLQYPLKAVETLAQEMKHHQLKPTPSTQLQIYLTKSVGNYHANGTHLLSAPLISQPTANPENIILINPPRITDLVNNIALTNKEIILPRSYCNSFDELYKRYFSYRIIKYINDDNSIPELKPEQFFNYWLRAIVQQEQKTEIALEGLFGKKNSRFNQELIKPRVECATTLNTDYLSNSNAQEEAAWLAQHVDSVFSYNLKPELRKLIKKS